MKIKRKPKSTDKDNGPTSPTIPSITYDSVFDSGRELSSDVYSTVGTGTACSAMSISLVFLYALISVKNSMFRDTHTQVLHKKRAPYVLDVKPDF